MNIGRFVFLSLSFLFLNSWNGQVFAQEQKEKELDILELAEKEADRLQELLDLEDWQVFYVDSTLKHDYPAMRKEMEDMGKAKVSNSALYVAVQDKWMDTIELSYRNIFNDGQWAEYLKSGAAKQQKARARRREKAEASLKKQK